MTNPTTTVRESLAYFFKVVDPLEDYFCSLLVQPTAIFYHDYTAPTEGQLCACHALRALAVEYALRHIVQLLSPDESGMNKEVRITIKRDAEDVDGIKVEIECHLARTHQFTAFA